MRPSRVCIRVSVCVREGSALSFAQRAAVSASATSLRALDRSGRMCGGRERLIE